MDRKAAAVVVEEEVVQPLVTWKYVQKRKGVARVARLWVPEFSLHCHTTVTSSAHDNMDIKKSNNSLQLLWDKRP